MRAGGRKARAATGWRRIEMELAKAGKILRESGFAVSDAEPIEAYGHYDRQGRPRRLHVRYPDGWRATLVLHVGGGHSLSYALKLVSKPKGETA